MSIIQLMNNESMINIDTSSTNEEMHIHLTAGD